MIDPYLQFLQNKIALPACTGFKIGMAEINPVLKPHQKAIVQWMVEGGRRACFAAFGLGKSVIQIEWVRITRAKVGGMGLIIMPLGVRQEFTRDATMLGVQLHFVRRIEECHDPDGIYITNYETIRDGKLNPHHFTVASLDEAACLRGFGGSKTFREFMKLFTGDAGPSGNRRQEVGVKYRAVATALPSPNDLIEILAYAAFLGIMDVSAAKTRFFKRDSTKADQLTLHPHKEQEFWIWVSTWAMFVQKPSDLGFSDEGYEFPPLDVRWHEIPIDHKDAGTDKSGQMRLLRNAAIGVQDAAKEKRLSLDDRIAKLMELRAEDPTAHRVIWHDLEVERHAIQAAIPNSVAVYGTLDLEKREEAIIGFSNGEFRELSAKPVIAGSGCNLQHHCSWAIYLGIGFKAHDFIQSVHRLQRFMQKHTVRIDLIYTEAERDIRRQLERKWQQHKDMVEKMTQIIKENGLSMADMAQNLTRAMGVKRVEIVSDTFMIVNNDCVQETSMMAENSVGLILTSIPFSTQYEYSPNYCDFGHTDNNDHFFQQMDFLTPNLLRILQPGRIAAIHVKDRIVPSGMTGLGFQVAYPFHCKTIEHYTRHGFAYLGMKTIVTDVVRENNQTYRLGWTEQCKDGSKMGVGMPEYLLLFRKPPTDTVNSYADVPVTKSKPDCVDADGNQAPWNRDLKEISGTGYSRARWQVDAHGFTRSSGNRSLLPDEIASLPSDQVFKLFKQHSLNEIYDFEYHVKIGEELGVKGRLPSDFMLLQPQSWHEDVWTDITRMRTLNGVQSAKGREMHLCPMQYDIADRVIEQMSNPGDVVFDPFGGLLTVAVRAILKKRFGMATELSSQYFLDGATYCKAAEEEVTMPGLFDVLESAA